MNRYQVRARADAPTELIIYGDIGQDWWAEESNDAKSIVEAIGNVKGELHLRINSYGGIVADGIAIYNALRRYSRREGGNWDVVTHVDGVAYSIASLIAMAGDEIRMADNALLMIHAPWGAAIGNADEMRKMADVLDKHSAAMSSSYLRLGGPDESTVNEWLTDGDDHYFTATEAQDLGLVDEIDESIEVADIAASLRTTDKRYKIPAARRRITKEIASMANEENGGATVTPTEESTVQRHSRTVRAAEAKGVKAEASRRKRIEEVFADFYDADPLNPITALHDECLEDTNCTDATAQQKLLALLAHQTANPVVASTAYGMERGYQAPPNADPRQARLNVTGDQQDRRAKGMTQALKIKAGLVTDREVIDAERKSEYLSQSLTDYMGHELRANGYSAGGTREDIARAYVQRLPLIMAAGPSHGTDHLPSVLGNIANLSAMQGWEGSPETWMQWTLAGTLNNYQTATRANVALLDKLTQMSENQQWEYGDMADVKQRITGYFYGLKYGLSIQAITNDDLGELSRVMMGWGEAASATVGDAVHALITTAGTGGLGQVMDEDSKVLFHADHSNYIASGAGGAPTEAALNVARTAMLTQTDPNSRTVAAIPRYLLHSVSLWSTVHKLLNSQEIQSVSVDGATGATVLTGEINAARDMNLTPVEEYRLTAGNWALAAARRTVEVAGVGGPVTPRAEQSVISDTPGITYELSMPFGVAALDFRGLYFNYGS